MITKIGVHDRPDSAFRINRIECSRSNGIGVHDPPEYAEKERAALLREFLFKDAAPRQSVTPKAVSKRLKAHLGEPIRVGAQTLTLMVGTDPHTKVMGFYVRQKAA